MSENLRSVYEAIIEKSSSTKVIWSTRGLKKIALNSSLISDSKKDINLGFFTIFIVHLLSILLIYYDYGIILLPNIDFLLLLVH